MEPQMSSETPPTLLQKNKSAVVLVMIVIVLGLVLACVILLKQSRKGQALEEYQSTNDAIDAVSASIITEESVTSNPVENKIPELNPVDKTNPYASYKNPFE